MRILDLLWAARFHWHNEKALTAAPSFIAGRHGRSL